MSGISKCLPLMAGLWKLRRMASDRKGEKGEFIGLNAVDGDKRIPIKALKSLTSGEKGWDVGKLARTVLGGRCGNTPLLPDTAGTGSQWNL